MSAPAPDAPDPGGPSAARRAWVVVLLLLLAITLLQQWGGGQGGRSAPPAPGGPGFVSPPDAPLEISARVTIKLFHAWGASPETGRLLLGSLERGVRAPEDRLRLAVAAAELAGPDAALARLDRLEPDLPPDSPLRDDIGALRALLAGHPLAPEDQERLERRHGWFGRLAGVLGRERDDPARNRLVGGGGALLRLFVLLLALGGSGLVAGFVLLVVGLVRAWSGSLRLSFVPPSPGGSVLLETVALFMAAFLALKFVVGMLALAGGETVARVGGLMAQWSLVLVLFWPLWRGHPLRRTLADLGLHRGRGVLQEVIAGFLGYLACLPLLVGGLTASLTLWLIRQGIRAWMGQPPAPPPENPVVDFVTQAQAGWQLILFVALASLWAPLVEETVFRGAFYAHLRARFRCFLAALLVALAFGLMHGYPLLMLGPVISLGFGFALLREWRGSLIASMTAHFLHNTVVLTLLLTLLRLSS